MRQSSHYRISSSVLLVTAGFVVAHFLAGFIANLDFVSSSNKQVYGCVFLAVFGLVFGHVSITNEIVRATYAEFVLYILIMLSITWFGAADTTEVKLFTLFFVVCAAKLGLQLCRHFQTIFNHLHPSSGEAGVTSDDTTKPPAD